jgi:hypothetical protein
MASVGERQVLHTHEELPVQGSSSEVLLVLEDGRLLLEEVRALLLLLVVLLVEGRRVSAKLT